MIAKQAILLFSQFSSKRKNLAFVYINFIRVLFRNITTNLKFVFRLYIVRFYKLYKIAKDISPEEIKGVLSKQILQKIIHFSFIWFTSEITSLML